jgi:colanic acid biosynthesis glycosyl transferase WcaI
LHVLIIGQYFPPDLGGAATRAYNVAKGLALNGCKVIRTFVLPLRSKGVFRRLLIFGSFAVSSLFVLPVVGKVDVVWAANPDILILFPSLAYGIVKKKPIVSNVDDLIIEDLYDLGLLQKGSIVSKVAEFFARVMFAKVKAVTPISPGYTATVTGYGVHQSKIHIVRGGVDLDVFQQDEHAREIDGKFVVLYSGSFSIAYDFEQIFRAAKIIERLDADVEFVVQGKGELLKSMRARVNELNVKNVRIIDKLLRRDEVAKLLGQADALILPLADFKKPYRGLSSKLYEYQAAGKPVICCSRGVPEYYIKETRSGIVIHPGDHIALANAVFELKANMDLGRMLGRNGREYVVSQVSIEAVGMSMKETLENLS